MKSQIATSNSLEKYKAETSRLSALKGTTTGSGGSPTFTPVENKDGTISINKNSKYTITLVSDNQIQVNAPVGSK
jgi:hypothetical protein